MWYAYRGGRCPPRVRPNRRLAGALIPCALAAPATFTVTAFYKSALPFLPLRFLDDSEDSQVHLLGVRQAYLFNG